MPAGSVRAGSPIAPDDDSELQQPDLLRGARRAARLSRSRHPARPGPRRRGLGQSSLARFDRRRQRADISCAARAIATTGYSMHHLIESGPSRSYRDARPAAARRASRTALHASAGRGASAPTGHGHAAGRSGCSASPSPTSLRERPRPRLAAAPVAVSQTPQSGRGRPRAARRPAGLSVYLAVRDSMTPQPASARGRARSPRSRARASLAVPAMTRPMMPWAMAERRNIENAT